MRPSWIDVDLGAVRENVAAVAALGTPVCAVVKADAYGHGDVPVAAAALEAGAESLAVALVEEGVRLREGGITAPVLLLSEPPGGDIPEAVAWGLTPTVYRTETLDLLAWAAARSGTPVAVHVKVDTGMHRAGADEETALELVAGVAAGPLVLGGVWSHLASAESDPQLTALQVERFGAFCRRLVDAGLPTGRRHLANTAGALLHPETRHDLVRIGLGAYGLHPSPACRRAVDLRPALRLVSQVSFVREYPEGTRLSYGHVRPLPRDAAVVTVPVGYADGVPRRLAESGEVLVGGRRRPFAGVVTMDQILVEVGDDPVAVGDEVVLIGRQGDEEITVDEWAERTGTISYEIVCGFGPRLPRHYEAG